MILRAKLTSKGQLTLPEDVRRKLGVESGDRVIFELEGDEVRVRAEKRRPLSVLRGSLPARQEYPGREAERRAAREQAVLRHTGGTP
jgi:AbrB family looped-hinge helix DNA binding protein